MDRKEGYGKLLYVLRARVRQLKVRSPGEAEEFFLARMEDANPIKDLLLLQAQREDYRNIESRLREELDSEMRSER